MQDDWASQLAISDRPTQPDNARENRQHRSTTGTGQWYYNQDYNSQSWNYNSQSWKDTYSRHWQTAGTGQQPRRDPSYQRPRTPPRRTGASSLTLTEVRRGRYDPQPTRRHERNYDTSTQASRHRGVGVEASTQASRHRGVGVEAGREVSRRGGVASRQQSTGSASSRPPSNDDRQWWNDNRRQYDGHQRQ